MKYRSIERFKQSLIHDLPLLGEQTALWMAIKQEVKRRGHWKNKERGNPKLGFKLGAGRKNG